MKRTRVAGFAALLIAVTAVAVIVCGYVLQGGPVEGVSGTITRGGKPLEWDSDEGHLLVLLIREDRTVGEDPVRATTDRATGTFRLPPLKKGHYRVAVHQFVERHKDVFNNLFDPAVTPLRAEITHDGQTLEIDIPAVLPKGNARKEF